MQTRGEPQPNRGLLVGSEGEYKLTYFADLSLYGYCWAEPRFNERVLNIGWLDPGVPFNKGAVDSGVMEKLFRLCEKPVNRFRGYHSCPYGLLDSPPAPCSSPATVSLGPWTLVLGDAEIRVPGQNGIIYAAPTLIFHYIQRHGYCPPAEFLEAVNRCG